MPTFGNEIMGGRSFGGDLGSLPDLNVESIYDSITIGEDINQNGLLELDVPREGRHR